MGHTVLVVDDEPFVRVAVASLTPWADHGYDFRYEAANGAQALELVRDHPEIDVVLLDLSMPVVDGIGFLEALPQVRGDAAPSVVVLSAHDDFPLVRRAFTLGAADYILKSEIDGGSLVALLDKVSATQTSARASGLDAAQREFLIDQWLKDLLSGADWSPVADSLGSPLTFPVTLWAIWINDIDAVTSRHGDGMERFGQLFLRTVRQVCERRGTGRAVALSHELVAVFTGPEVETGLFAAEVTASLQRYLSVKIDLRSSPSVESARGLAETWRTLLTSRPAASRIVLQTLRYLRERFATPVIPLEDLAAHVGVSKNHLSYEFARETGETITDHLARLRVQEACRYLATTNLKVYEIAERVGYTNVEHFCRVFKKVAGTSPARWMAEAGTSVFRDIRQ